MSMIPTPISTQTLCTYTDEWHGRAVVIGCSGEIDTVSAPDLLHHVDGALGNQPTALIIDLSDVSFLASAGMSVLIDAHDRTPADARFIVVANGPVTSRPLELVGLTAIIDVRATLEEALRDAAAPGGGRGRE
jgi:anti-sigma B factor antagonist